MGTEMWHKKTLPRPGSLGNIQEKHASQGVGVSPAEHPVLCPVHLRTFVPKVPVATQQGCLDSGSASS